MKEHKVADKKGTVQSHTRSSQCLKEHSAAR